MPISHSLCEVLMDVSELSHSVCEVLMEIDEGHSLCEVLMEVQSEGHSTCEVLMDVCGEQFLLLTSDVNPATWLNAGTNIHLAATCNLNYAGVDLTNCLQDVEFDLPLQGVSSCTFNLTHQPDEFGMIRPGYLNPPGAGPLENKMIQHAGTRERAFVFSGKWAGEPWQSEEFYPVPISTSNGIKWGGKDLFDILDCIPAQSLNLEDIVRAAGDSVMAHTAMRQLADAIGIQIECRFPNYLIGELPRASGTARKIADDIAEAMRALGRIENGRIIYEQATLNQPVAWRFRDQCNIRQLECNELPRAANSFLVVRFTPGGGQVGEARGNQVGRIQVPIEEPVRSVAIDILEVLQGDLRDWVYFAESGQLLNTDPAGPIFDNITPISRAEATYYPHISGGLGSYTPSWHVQVRGSIFKREENYRFPADDTEHQGLYGIVLGDDKSKPIYGDAAGAALGVEAALKDSVRRQWQCNLEADHWNPRLKRGQVIEVRDALTGQVGIKWLVERVKPVRKNGYWACTIEAYNRKGMQP